MNSNCNNSDDLLLEPLSPQSLGIFMVDTRSQNSAVSLPLIDDSFSFGLDARIDSDPYVQEDMSFNNCTNWNITSDFDLGPNWSIPSQFNNLPAYLYDMPQPNELNSVQYVTPNDDILRAPECMVGVPDDLQDPLSPSILGQQLEESCNIPSHASVTLTCDFRREIEHLKSMIEEIYKYTKEVPIIRKELKLTEERVTKIGLGLHTFSEDLFRTIS